MGDPSAAPDDTADRASFELAALGAAPPPERRWRPHLRTVVALLVLLPLAGAAFVAARSAVDREAAATRARAADEVAGGLRSVSASAESDTRSLVGLFSTSRQIDDLANFAQPALQNRALVALAWAPRVTQPMRRSFEQTAGFPISELKGGVPVSAGRRPELYPIQYVEPGPANVSLVGVDVATQPGLAAAMAAAVASGGDRVTAPVTLPNGRRGIVVVAPAFQRGASTGSAEERRSVLTGYAVGMYDLDTLVGVALAGQKAAGITITDAGAPVFAHGDAAAGTSRTLAVGGRSWRIQVAARGGSSGALLPWVVLAAGLLVALLLAAMVEQNGRRLTFAERLVALRTTALRDALGLLGRANGDLETARIAAERASQVDALTGAFDRAHLIDRVKVEVDRSRRGGRTPAVVVVHVDDYRELVQQYGLDAGDEVLRAVADRLRSMLRSYDALGRIAPAQFAVLAPDVPDDHALSRVAEAARQVVTAAPIMIDGHELWPKASVGAARADEERPDALQLLAAADEALAEARRRGRNRTVLAGTADDVETGEADAVRIARALASSAATREGMPAGHDREVAELAAAIARQLDLAPELVERCHLAGWLHDVGKVGIPQHILAKPEQLTDDEWEVMRTHSTLGAAVVGRIPQLADAADGVRHHHERWDGTGYPDRLAGPAIPLEARVVAVADAYSAMTADPPFRRSRGPRGALREIRAGAGSQFDPAIVEALAVAIATPRAA